MFAYIGTQHKGRVEPAVWTGKHLLVRKEVPSGLQAEEIGSHHREFGFCSKDSGEHWEVVGLLCALNDSLLFRGIQRTFEGRAVW